MKILEFTVPLRTVSEANQREHWGLRNKRRAAQQEEITVCMLSAKRGREIDLPCVVSLTRIGPKTLDTDNLSGSFKHVRDAIAKLLGVDDGEIDKVNFQYSQTANGKRVYAINVKIESAGRDENKGRELALTTLPL